MSTDYFIDENEQVDQRKTVLSPSGKYSLLIRQYSTKAGSWNYSRGTVVEVKTDRQVADIKRCYSSFMHAFITKPEAEYLIAGRSYMGQTIVNLLTGEEWNDPNFYRKLEEGEDDRQFGNYEGYEFCWAEVTPFADTNTLMVDGCHWACPYQYNFYDFTDPSKGWPELKIEGSKIGIEYLGPDEFQNFDYDEDAEDGPASEYNIVEIEHHPHQPEVKFTNPDLQVVLRRYDNCMRVVSEWSSERRTKANEEYARATKEREDKFTAAREGSPYFTWLRAQKTEGIQSDPSYSSHYPSQNDVTNGDTNWIYLGLRFEKEGAPKKATTATVKWGVVAGEIYVESWVYGTGNTKTNFERSQAGLEAAYAFAVGKVLG